MDKNELIKAAFRKACKYLREHPPVDAWWAEVETRQVVVDAKSDPEGERWMQYFINKVLKEETEGK